MTPAEWDKQIIPPHTTRHAISILNGCKVFYRDDVTPHQQWNGRSWVDLGENGDCHSYTSPLNEAPYMYTSRSYCGNHGKHSPIYTDAKYKGD